MQLNFFTRAWFMLWSRASTDMTPQEIGWLLQPRQHIFLLESRRAQMVLSRVRLVTALFAILTPLWSVVDIVAFSGEIWPGLVAARLMATGAFIALLIFVREREGIFDAYRALALMLAIPAAFFAFSYHYMAGFQLHGLEAAMANGYAFLPFVMLAGLSIFPLTLIENLTLAAPTLVVYILSASSHLQSGNLPTIIAMGWLLLLLSAVAALAGLSQLAFMIVLVREAIRDSMTGSFSRASGVELLQLQFTLAIRNGSALTLTFIDIDHFKSINDTWGHDTGDRVLQEFAANLRQHLRTGDILVRWGGEEFLIIMPGTTLQEGCHAINRISQAGLGQRPDGTPLTASIGVAERCQDHADNWSTLVETADQRMYAAKNAGRNRTVGCVPVPLQAVA